MSISSLIKKSLVQIFPVVVKSCDVEATLVGTNLALWLNHVKEHGEREKVFLSCHCLPHCLWMSLSTTNSQGPPKNESSPSWLLKGWVSGWFKLQACVWPNKADPWRVFFQMYIWHLCFILAPFREWRPFKSNIICVEWGFTLKKPATQEARYQFPVISVNYTFSYWF